MITIVQGDLLEATEKYIAHQCNSVTTTGSNLARSVFLRFPYADIYRERVYGQDPKPEQLPGNIVVRGNGMDQRFVINMIGQYYPGRAKYSSSSRDGWNARLTAFKECLRKILEIPELESIAFPFMIGCGAAGGDWSQYQPILQEFSQQTPAKVVLYKLQ